MAMMEHLPPAPLALLFSFLTAPDVARLTATCHALEARSETVQRAIGVAVKFEFGDVAGFLREDDGLWPRVPLVLRAIEMLRVKKLLQSASVMSFEDAYPKTAVVTSRAWVLAMKKRCQQYEQFAAQFRNSKKQQQRQQQQARRTAAAANDPFVDSELQATREAGLTIVCPHGQLLPAAQCVGRKKRVVVTRGVWRKLSAYAGPSARGFPVLTVDCYDCVTEKEAADRAEEARKHERFEAEMGDSVDLVDLLLRKNGFPNELFSPATTRGHTHLSLQNGFGKSYYLVPKKWVTKWRQYVRSMADDKPGPIHNSELVCLTHQRSIVPPYITMFLSGFSIEQSLQATQALDACMSTQYEIVTQREWDALFERYCGELAFGFDVTDGSYHWRTPECHICHYGMGMGIGRPPRPNSNR
ncbi:TPA: hypothetical protein N0F65_001818 [Lagenidium giganteum]|uniref:DUSP domain-containing protein n=1 Tax=Lagenidium giganteum TaxID=4803 RepID=A0AAV2Z2X4_9STRA|nr:TPA: hypothetical protein N0F65_001818 [Lagenidium giganteum]